MRPLLTCHSIGFSSIEDPGPPRTNYCASPVTLDAIITSTSSQTLAIKPSSLPASKTRSTGPVSAYTTTATHTRTSIVPLATTSVLLDNSNSTGQISTGLPGGAKAAIGIFSILAALAITTILLLILRKCRKDPKRQSQAPLLIPYRNNSHREPSSGSQAPLIVPPPPLSSSRNSPLTPPAKLCDRKYLHPAVKPGAPRSSTTLSIGNTTIPPSPTFVPTHSKLIPKHERTATTSGIRFPAAKSAPVTSHCPQGSVYSLSSGPGTSTVTVASNKASSVHSGSVTIMGTSTPPLSPTKFARAHEGSLESSDLVTPAGPPPKRALPPPPSNHPNSPTFSVTPVSPLSPTFPPRILTRGDSPMVPAPLVSNSCATPPTTSTSTSTKELCDLTESYARETREMTESWGSWSGVGGGGGGPGVTPISRKRGCESPGSPPEKKGENSTPVPLQELDPEKLSGRH